jgi:hypothetical protein
MVAQFERSSRIINQQASMPFGLQMQGLAPGVADSSYSNRLA